MPDRSLSERWGAPDAVFESEGWTWCDIFAGLEAVAAILPQQPHEPASTAAQRPEPTP